MEELPQDRLATIDARGKRVYLYPAVVHGVWKSRKKIVHAILLLVFLLLPWIYVNGRQALLLDVSERSFSIFGLFLRGHDAPLLFFLLIGFALSIAFVTAIWGRVWCGWACPQTVFIESIFRRLETWIEGNSRTRKALDEAPWSFEKIMKKTLKWGAFLAVSLLITHSFLAYFVGSHKILQMILRAPSENWASFLVILFTTGIILLDFGWFREQFCVIMCPYGRFQSVLLDDDSIVVGYDVKRGEPRRGEVAAGAKQGDCVNCLRCVQVCPTGIDIRRGVQLECIACTACIDACDEVMSTIKKPKGLIRYTSENSLRGLATRWMRGRTYVYLSLLSVVGIVFIGLLSQQQSVEISILRAKEAPYQTLPQADGSRIIVNHLIADFSNQSSDNNFMDLRLTDLDKAAGIELVMPIHPLAMAPHEQHRTDFFLRFPSSDLKFGTRKIELDVFRNNQILTKEELSLVGPSQ